MKNKEEEQTLINLLFNDYLNKLYLDEKINFSTDKDDFTEEFDKFIKKYFSDIEIDEDDPIDRRFIETLEYTVYKGVLDYKVKQNIFLSHLDGNYAKAFSTSDALYVLSLEIGNTILANHYAETSALTEVLQLLHTKSCQIYAEISTLIKNGFGTGAMARFRSLYETSIVIGYIFQKGENAAQAYLDYLLVADMKEEKLLKGLYPDSYKENTELVTKFKNEKEKLIVEYDEQFVNLKNKDYTWAYYTLDKQNGHNIGINQLKKEINRNDGEDQYKLASNIIHSSTKSVFSNMGNPYRTTTAGGSNIGLSQPIILSSYEMMRINNILLNNIPLEDNILENLERLFTMKTNYVLYDEIYKSFSSIEDEILDDFYETKKYQKY